MANTIRQQIFRTLRTWACTAAAIGLAALSAPGALAAAYTYSTRVHTINAGILVADDGGSGNVVNPATGVTFGFDPDPYVFYVLDQRLDILPAGWNIVNPLAPSIVTGSILSRWNNQTGSTGPTLTLDQTITPNMGAYWEVSLSQTSLANLEQYNILLLNLQDHTVRFTDAEVNNLRQYVDNGGQLWIEDSGDGALNTTDPLFMDMNFLNGGGASVTSGNVILPSTSDGLMLHQPVIGSPYLLTPEELNTIGNQPGHQQIIISNSSAIAGTDTGIPDTGILSPVLVQPSYKDLPVIADGQFGAGQVIIDTVGSAAAINDDVGGIEATIGGVPVGPNSGPYCGNSFANAQADDLKFVSDILSWETAHPNEHQTSHQSNQSPNTLGPAISPTWTFPDATPGTTTPGAAINGSFIYVRDADGILRCFNATPGTDIIGTGIPDAGMLDYEDGDPYDQVWNTSGAANSSFKGVSPPTFDDVNGSAPTVVSTPDGATTVFIENSAGNIYAYDATTGAASGTYGTGGVITAPTGGGTAVSYGTNGIPGPAPAPTYFDGRLYCGEANGSLFVYDCRTPADSGTYQVGGANEWVAAPPTVGIVHENLNVGNAGYADDLVATVTTNAGTYTVQVGAFHDYLIPQGGTGNYTPSQANTSGPFDLDDTAGTYSAYNDNGGYQYLLDPTVSGTSFVLGTAPTSLPVFGDYDVDIVNSPANSLLRDDFELGSAGDTSPSISPSVLDENGNFYYVANATGASAVDSTVVCAHDGRPTETSAGREAAVQMQWRYRLPYVGENDGLDADGVSNAALEGFVFVGAPVVDSKGHCFALATNGTETALLCFNSTGEVTLQLPANSTEGTVRVTSLEQAISGGSTDEFGQAAQPVVGGGTQYNGLVDANGEMQLQSFGADSAPTVVPDLSEPQPVQATYSLTVNGAGTTTVAVAAMHTNLAWYTILPSVSFNEGAYPVGESALPNFPTSVDATASLALVGNYLFFGDTNGYIYRVDAYPQNDSLVNSTSRFVPLTQTSSTDIVTATDDEEGRPLVAYVNGDVGAIEGVLSTGNNVLVANGQKGVAAFSSEYDLVSDSTRVMEVDSEGVATWLVDGTSETDPTTGLATHLAMNDPSDVTQVTSNDYLVADTGNNRCVRFDRSGNVIWELTRFNDLPLTSDGTTTGTPITFFSSASGLAATKTAPILSPGEPLTLNHPTSVTSYVQNVTNSSGTSLGTIVHYLIADTGNDRIVEVVDAFDSKGNPVGPPHDLVWVSRTYDALGRDYEYTNANYFTGSTGLAYIAAIVKNTRIAAIPGFGQMQSVNKDAPGSSIVLLDYDPANANPTIQKDGYVADVASYFLNYLNANNTFDLADSPKQALVSGSDVYEPANTSPIVTYLRNPRFLQTYTPPGGGTENFLFADDNGVYDLHFDTTGADSGGATPAQYADNFEAQWGFTQSDYQGITNQGQPAYIPGISIPAPITRADVPFVPNSIQRTTTDNDTMGTVTYLMGHYIVTNGYSSGQVTPVSGFGGEVLELQVPDGTMSTVLVNSFGDVSGAAPLSQPTFAGREK